MYLFLLNQLEEKKYYLFLCRQVVNLRRLIGNERKKNR